MIKTNQVSRNTIVSTIETLFRVPEEAGPISLIYYIDQQIDSNVLPLHPMNSECQKFFDAILNHISANQDSDSTKSDEEELRFDKSTNPNGTDVKVYYVNQVVLREEDITSPLKKLKNNSPEKTSIKSSAPLSKSKNKASPSADKVKGRITASKSLNRSKGKRTSKVKQDEGNDDEEWTKSHESIGTKISKKFGGEIYTGEVTRYLPPSKPDANDALYHILYTDGDEEDMSDDELARGKSLYLRQPIEWAIDHYTIGTKVGRPRKIKFSETSQITDESNNIDNLWPNIDVIEHGMVVRYALGRVGNDQLYEIVWENGVTEQLGEKKFRIAVETYLQDSAGAVSDVTDAEKLILPDLDKDKLEGNDAESAKESEIENSVAKIDMETS